MTIIPLMLIGSFLTLNICEIIIIFKIRECELRLFFLLCSIIIIIILNIHVYKYINNIYYYIIYIYILLSSIISIISKI